MNKCSFSIGFFDFNKSGDEEQTWGNQVDIAHSNGKEVQLSDDTTSTLLQT